MRGRGQEGFSLLEVMIATLILLVLTAGAIATLTVAQQRSQAESEALDAFQSARFGLDQVVRDVGIAGYPPARFFSTPPAAQLYAQTAFAWNPNYPATPCTVGSTCTTPGAYDLIVETDIDPQNKNGVEWVRYQLQGTTLMRGVVSKVAGADPAATTQPALVPYVSNVMNNASSAQINQLRGIYPRLFPGGLPVPVFTYTYDPGTTGTPPNKIHEVNITLIVMASQPDPRTGQPRVVTLTGRARRMNPS